MINAEQKKLIREFAIESGKKALKSQGNLQIFAKGSADVVTEIDKEIELEFSKLVAKEFPEMGFLGEEFEELKKEGEFVWAIDPIDGTKYYAKQIPLWTVTIALLKNNEPIYGLIYFPAMDQLFEAEKGGGAILNGKKLEVTNNKPKSDQMLSWDCPSYNKFSKSCQVQIMKDLRGYFKEYYRVRNMGVAALSCCWITTGMFGGFIKYVATEKEALDNYAGLIIAQEAGCSIKTSHLDGFLKIEVLI